MIPQVIAAKAMHKHREPISAGHQPGNHLSNKTPGESQLAAPAWMWAHRFSVHMPHGNRKTLVGRLAERRSLGKGVLVEIDVSMEAVDRHMLCPLITSPA